MTPQSACATTQKPGREASLVPSPSGEGALTHIEDVARRGSAPEPPSKQHMMAIFRFSVKHGSRGNGKSGRAHACYILRTERYEYASHQLIHAESGNMPEWATSAIHFWEAADEHEAQNARIYSEFEIALPREMTHDQQVNLTKDFVRAELGDKHPYTLAIHEVEAMDGGSNPHAHVMFTTRTMDNIRRSEELFFKRANKQQPDAGGAIKERSWIKKSRLQELRESWQSHANLALKRAGHEIAIDHRTLEAQGIERTPEPKLTPFEAMLWKQGVKTERVEEILLLRELAASHQRQEAQDKHRVTLKEIQNLKSFEARVGETLAEQRKALESNLSERDRIDRRIERLDEELQKAPGSEADAHKMAKDLMFGPALSAHLEMIQSKRKERDQLAEEFGEGGIAEFVSHVPGKLRQLGKAFEAQRALDAAKKSYRDFVAKMDSPEAKQDSEQFAKELYRAKVEAEGARNALVQDALSIRGDIDEYTQLIAKTETMLKTVQCEIEEASQHLSPALRAWVAPVESQIKIGQEVNTYPEAKVEKSQEQQLKLKHSLNLLLRGDDELPS